MNQSNSLLENSEGSTPAISNQPPNNIVNMLANECIQKVFSYLGARDLASVAQVCKRFQENAIECHSKQIEFPYLANYHESIPPHHVSSYLRIFGNTIKRLRLFGEIKRNASDRQSWAVLPSKYKRFRVHYLNLIGKYCGKHLTTFRVHLRCTDELNFNTAITSQFSVLKGLEIIDCTLNQLAPFAKLHYLSLKNVKIVNCSEFANHFPHLKQVQLRCVDFDREDLLIEFQRNNPQLQYLEIQYCNTLSSRIFENIQERLPNLEQLFIQQHYRSDFPTEVRAIRAHVQDVSRLTKLTHLRIALMSTGWRDLMDFLVKRDPNEHSNVPNRNDIEIVPKFNQLRLLIAMCWGIRSAMNIIENIPTLKTLRSVVVETTDEIIEILEKPYQLSSIRFLLDENIDLNKYNKIWNLVENRIEVAILYYGKINVDQNIVEKNSSWIKFFDARLLDPTYTFHFRAHYS